MEYTTFKITTESRDKLKGYAKAYNKKSVSDFVVFLLDYLENNKVDLNVNLNQQTISLLDNLNNNLDNNFQNIDKHFESNSEQMIKDAKRLEHLISVVKNIEKEYFFPLKEQGLLKVATEREMKEDLKYKDLFEDLINKISSIYSTKRQMDVFLVDISKTEFNILKDYARKF